MRGVEEDLDNYPHYLENIVTLSSVFKNYGFDYIENNKSKLTFKITIQALISYKTKTKIHFPQEVFDNIQSGIEKMMKVD